MKLALKLPPPDLNVTTISLYKENVPVFTKLTELVWLKELVLVVKVRSLTPPAAGTARRPDRSDRLIGRQGRHHVRHADPAGRRHRTVGYRTADVACGLEFAGRGRIPGILQDDRQRTRIRRRNVERVQIDVRVHTGRRRQRRGGRARGDIHPEATDRPIEHEQPGVAGVREHRTGVRTGAGRKFQPHVRLGRGGHQQDADPQRNGDACDARKKLS